MSDEELHKLSPEQLLAHIGRIGEELKKITQQVERELKRLERVNKEIEQRKK